MSMGRGMQSKVTGPDAVTVKVNKTIKCEDDGKRTLIINGNGVCELSRDGGGANTITFEKRDLQAFADLLEAGVRALEDEEDG